MNHVRHFRSPFPHNDSLTKAQIVDIGTKESQLRCRHWEDRPICRQLLSCCWPSIRTPLKAFQHTVRLPAVQNPALFKGVYMRHYDSLVIHHVFRILLLIYFCFFNQPFSTHIVALCQYVHLICICGCSTYIFLG